MCPNRVERYVPAPLEPAPHDRLPRAGDVDLEALSRQRADEAQHVGGDPARERLRGDQESEEPVDNRRVFFVAFEPSRVGFTPGMT
jgi:hypothetical protein